MRDSTFKCKGVKPIRRSNMCLICLFGCYADVRKVLYCNILVSLLIAAPPALADDRMEFCWFQSGDSRGRPCMQWPDVRRLQYMNVSAVDV